MKTASSIPRHTSRGVVLITTLISLLLLIGLLSLLQSRTLASARVLSRLTHEIHAKMHVVSLRELSRPLLGEAMLESEAGDAIRLNGTPLEVTYEGRKFVIVAQDLGGLVSPWRTPRVAVEQLLNNWQLEVWQSFREEGNPGVPLRMQAARRGLLEAPSWLSTDVPGRRLSRQNISVLYGGAIGPLSARYTTWRQPEILSLSIEKLE